jgi:putative (di)nucleoside polyphosphate hydrolase
MTSDLPYRRNVGAMLFNRDGLVFVGRRANMPDSPSGYIWQMPQGGIDRDEAPEVAVLRELGEEIGTANASILAQHPEWLTYDLPPELVGQVLGGRYRGQTQKWFALRFLGADAEIRLDVDAHPEFDAWRWVPIHELPELAVPFKRAIYARLTRDFRSYGTNG